MKIKINKDTTIREIQEKFSKEFPYLLIQFFRKPHGHFIASHKKEMIDSNLKIGDIRKTVLSGHMNIDPKMTVAGLEQGFWAIFGLSAQVFRQSGTAWLETTVTDSWTLEEQNEEGREMSVRIHEYIAEENPQEF